MTSADSASADPKFVSNAIAAILVFIGLAVPGFMLADSTIGALHTIAAELEDGIGCQCYGQQAELWLFERRAELAGIGSSSSHLTDLIHT